MVTTRGGTENNFKSFKDDKSSFLMIFRKIFVVIYDASFESVEL